jgi:hypothetical protein
MRRHVWRACGAAAMVTALFTASAGAQANDVPPACRPSGPTSAVTGLTEGSGLAASRRMPGRFYAHNDSSGSVLFVLDAGGRVVGQLRVPQVAIQDWEAVTVGPCAAGSCIYIGDIGDNDAKRRRITVYRVPEPAAESGSLSAAEAIHATYPDGAQDAESLLVSPEGQLFIVTKGATGPVSLYRFPTDSAPGAAVRLERVGPPRAAGRIPGPERITDGAVSPDGVWVALRSNRSLVFYRSRELFTGTWREAGRIDLRALEEPQGEGIAFGADGAIHLVGESGGRSRNGTFGTLRCQANANPGG